jgi:hypothetical protein
MRRGLILQAEGRGDTRATRPATEPASRSGPAETNPEAATQPQGELHRNKTKKIQVNPRKRLGFAWIPLAELGLFNELRPKK